MQPWAKPESQLIEERNACHVESMGQAVEFSESEMADVEHILSRYPTKMAALLPLLWKAQYKWGWISTEIITYIAKLLELPESHVYGVVSFYTMYNRKPVGKYHLELCTNISCQLRGSEHILDCLREKLGIDLGETTADGMFTLTEAECLAACEMAPMMQIGLDFHGPLTPESATQLIDRLKSS